MRADDLAGTGLVSKQRWVLPLWVSVVRLLCRGGWRASVAILRWSVRAKRITVSLLVLLGVELWAGRRGVLAAVVVAAVVGVVWAWRWPASFGRWVAQPTRGAWRWRTRYRRLWHPVMDGVGLTRITPDRQVFVPRVTAVRSTRTVDVLHVRLLHGHTPEDIAASAEGMRHAFGAHRLKVVEAGPGRVRIVCYSRDPLTRVVPPIEPGTVPDLGAVPVGLAEDGQTYAAVLLGMHVLITGASGAGKGSVLWSIVRGLGPHVASGVVRLRGLDPKGGMELFPGRALFTHYADDNADELVELLERTVEDMNARKRRLKAAGLRAFVPSVADPLEVVIVDELAFLTAYAPTREIKSRVTTALSLLLSQGRAVGFCVIAALQDPRKDVLAFRNLFTYRIALRLTEDSEVDMVLGAGALDRGAACHRIPLSQPGVAFVYVDGAAEPVRVRFSYLTDADIRAMTERWPAPPTGPAPTDGSTPAGSGASDRHSEPVRVPGPRRAPHRVNPRHRVDPR
ncbi:MAG: cell division protein FtsK [Actinobacteria bacterium]|nr:cell division protein FtsK [Actinomycetota bacterium]MBI3688317.1 cell division protein FtsK [Actinomycetota bacterium]